MHDTASIHRETNILTRSHFSVFYSCRLSTPELRKLNEKNIATVKNCFIRLVRQNLVVRIKNLLVSDERTSERLFSWLNDCFACMEYWKCQQLSCFSSSFHGMFILVYSIVSRCVLVRSVTDLT